jgi:hypothetical protein
VMMSVMSVNPISPRQKASTQDSLAALKTAGAVPAALPARRASSTAPKVSESNGSKVHEAAWVQSQPAAASGRRSGQVSPRAMGSRMSGGEAWAIVAPSQNSTMECTTDCGWTTTVMSSRSTS